MKKNFLRKIVTAVIAATTIASFSSLGVSAATTNSNINDYYNSITANGKTYCLNLSDALDIEKVAVNNKIYETNLNGQVTGINAQLIDKIFNSNNEVITDSNKTSTVVNSDNNQGTTDPKSTSAIENTADTENSTSTGNAANNTTTENSTSANNSGNNTTTTKSNANVTPVENTTSTNATTVDVQGLPKLPTTYSINVQAAAEQKILELMNVKRTEAGLKPLTMDNTLLQIARYKSNNMIQNNYFDHTNPDGTKWTNWLQTIGYKYTTTGENIAYNTYDSVELFNQWWNSPGHRANMMNASYTKVGVGVIQGNGKYMGTQTFSN